MMSFIFLFLFSISGHASDENRGWLGIFSRKENESKTHVSHQELQVRYDLENGSNQQLLARFGILKPLNNTQELGFLFGYIETGELVEYRPTFQHILKGETSSGNWSLRSRLEWRDWEDRQTNSIRSRIQLSYTKKISTLATVVFWEEPFINLTHDSMSGERVFERNRAFVCVRVPIEGHHIELGYLNQFIPRQKDLTEHIGVVYIYF